MIAPVLSNGLKIEIVPPFYSKPYVMMTLNLMKKFGIKYNLSDDIISINNQKYKSGSYKVESDWSAASYWYSFMSINKKSKGLFILHEGISSTIFNSQVIEHILQLNNSDYEFDILSFNTEYKIWNSSLENRENLISLYPNLNIHLIKSINIFSKLEFVVQIVRKYLTPTFSALHKTSLILLLSGS